MLKMIVVGFYVCVAAPWVAGHELSMTLRVHDLVLGELSAGGGGRFQVNILNRGDADVFLARGRGTPFLLTSEYWRVDVRGPLDASCRAVRAVGLDSLDARYHSIRIPAHGRYRMQLAMEGIGAPGSYRVKVTYDGGAAPKDSPSPLWGGRLASPEVSFRIVQPVGVDWDLLKRWRQVAPDAPWCRFPIELMNELTRDGQDWDHFLLREYPASTYAAYLITRGGRERISEMAPADYLSCVDAGDCPAEGKIPDLGVRGRAWKSVDGNGMVRWRKKWYSLVLTHHPDIWFADELRLRLALDQLGIKNTEQATTMLQTLAEGAEGRVQKRARQYLSLALQRGIIKPSDIPAELRAKLPAAEAAKKPAAVNK